MKSPCDAGLIRQIPAEFQPRYRGSDKAKQKETNQDGHSPKFVYSVSNFQKVWSGRANGNVRTPDVIVEAHGGFRPVRGSIGFALPKTYGGMGMATDNKTADKSTEDVVILTFAGPESKRKEAIQALQEMGFIELGAMLDTTPDIALARELIPHSGQLTQGELEALLGGRR